MRILDLGSLGYQIGAAGIVAFTVAFLVSVRWWTDWLGRVIAGVLFSTSGVLAIVVLRQIDPDQEGWFLVARAIVFWVFGIAVWASLATFVWAQFFAPRIKGTRLVKMPDHTEGKKE
jgi:MFS family permease